MRWDWSAIHHLVMQCDEYIPKPSEPGEPRGHLQMLEVGEVIVALEFACDYLTEEDASTPPRELRRQIVEACQASNLSPACWTWIQESLAEEEE